VTRATGGVDEIWETNVSGELLNRVFTGLYGAYELHELDGVRVAVPRGTPVFAGPTLSDVARQISEHAAGGAL
jgi:hypothetical protein